jgi:hypothetical protein
LVQGLTSCALAGSFSICFQVIVASHSDQTSTLCKTLWLLGRVSASLHGACWLPRFHTTSPLLAHPCLTGLVLCIQMLLLCQETQTPLLSPNPPQQYFLIT